MAFQQAADNRQYILPGWNVNKETQEGQRFCFIAAKAPLHQQQGHTGQANGNENYRLCKIVD